MVNFASPKMKTNNKDFKKAVELIKKSNLFDREYYLDNNPDVKRREIDPLTHYLFYGFTEHRNPSKDFDNDFYLNEYPDIKSAQINPLVHYVLYGKSEQRIYNNNLKEYVDENESSIALSKKPIINHKFLTKDMIENLATSDAYYDNVGYYDELVSVLSSMDDINDILELEPYKSPLIFNSDILDSTDEFVEYYPMHINNFYLHNLINVPYPFESKRYDLVIIINTLGNIQNISQLQTFFNEIQRIADKLLLCLPYKTERLENNFLNMLDESKLDAWIEYRPVYQSVSDSYIIRIYEF